MANTTMTQRTFFEMVITANISDEVTEFAKSRVAHLDKANANRKTKGTKSQRENVEVKKSILAVMENGTIYTAAQIMAMEIDGVTSTQKASALLRQMTETGELTVSDIKIKGKGKVKGYALATPTGGETFEPTAE